MSDNLKKLQKQWYKKLKKSGFNDIEDTNSPNEFLNTWDSLYFLTHYSPGQFEAKQKYFTLARQFLEAHVFDTSKEKLIWSLYAEGMSIRGIARKLKLTKYSAHKIVKGLEGVMLGKRNA